MSLRKVWAALSDKADCVYFKLKISQTTGLLANTRSHKHIQQQDPQQAHRANQRFHQCPGLKGLKEIQPEIFFEHPKARIIDVRTHQTARTDGQHHQLRRNFCLCSQQRLHHPGGGQAGNRSRTQSYTDHQSHQPTQEKRMQG